MIAYLPFWQAMKFKEISRLFHYWIVKVRAIAFGLFKSDFGFALKKQRCFNALFQKPSSASCAVALLLRYFRSNCFAPFSRQQKELYHPFFYLSTIFLSFFENFFYTPQTLDFTAFVDFLRQRILPIVYTTWLYFLFFLICIYKSHISGLFIGANRRGYFRSRLLLTGF